MNFTHCGSKISGVFVGSGHWCALVGTGVHQWTLGSGTWLLAPVGTGNCWAVTDTGHWMVPGGSDNSSGHQWRLGNPTGHHWEVGTIVQWAAADSRQ